MGRYSCSGDALIMYSEKITRQILQIAESMPAIIATFSEDGYLFWLNQEGCKRLGIEVRDKEQFSRINITQLFTECSAEKVLNQAVPIAKTKGEWKGQGYLLTQKHHNILSSIYIRAFRRSENSLEFFCVTIKDIESPINETAMQQEIKFGSPEKNDSITSNISRRKYHITDLIDLSLLHQLFNSFYELTGISYAVLDSDNNFLSSEGFTDICTNFHRICPLTEKRCRQSDSYISEHLRDGPYVGYKCLNGLIDYATPIIVEGQHLGSIFAGQIFHESPDEEFFRRQAIEAGFDEESYLEAVHKVSVVPEEKVKSIMEFFSILGQMISKIGVEKVSRLEAAEDKFLKAFNMFPDPATITALDTGNYVDINDACIEIFGYKKDEIIGRSAVDLGIYLSLDQRNTVLEMIKENGYIRNVEIPFRCKSGQIRTLLSSMHTIIVENSPYLLGVFRDITDLRIMEERLRKSEAELRTIFETANGIIFTLSPEGKFMFVSRGWTKRLGHDISQVEGCLYKSFIHPDDVSLCTRYFETVMLTGESEKGVEYRAKHQDGSWRWFVCSGAAVLDDEDNRLYAVGIADDITERKQAEAEIRYLSYHDKLTGLYNRTFFEEELKRINTERQLPLGLIIGDVNGLKLINDAMGHLEGDKVLIKAAEIFNKACRHEDIISRWGGDEFIVLLPRCDRATTLKVFKRINDSFSRVNNLPIPINISLGLAVQNSLDRDIRDVIMEAEEKMYRNKLLQSRSTRSSFIKSLQKTLWERSHETEEHCQRMHEMAQKIGRALELTDSELDNLKLLAALHDIGKIAIPNSILDKPGKLSPEEWDTIRNHPEIGYRIALSSPELAPIAEAILHHHEWWNGHGYPLGLKGEKIPLISRIIAITDAYDVMTNGRPYKKAMSKAEALAEIKRFAGTQFDPELVRKELFFD